MRIKPLMRAALSVAAAAGLVAAALTGASQSAHADPIVTSPNDTKLAMTPPMGFNNWAAFGCTKDSPNVGDSGPSEALFIQQADQMISSGLAAAGYKTLIIDDCWMNRSRDAAGKLVPNPTTFPNGISGLATKLHAKGLKLGIYQDIGTSTCGGYPGSYGHFQTDADTFASWGIDYIKMDGCNVPAAENNSAGFQKLYNEFSAAMKNNASKRDMVLLSQAPAYTFMYGGAGSDWYDLTDSASKHAQVWRLGNDVLMSRSEGSRWDKPSHPSGVLVQYEFTSKMARYSAPGAWNDPDFLITGERLTDDESRTQISLWSMMASPLIMSLDTTKLSATNLANLKNADVIAVNQDALGKQAGIVSQDGTRDVLSRPLSNGDRAVAIFNRSGATASASVSLASLGMVGAGCTATVKDLWTGTSATTTTGISASIPSHGTVMYRVSMKDCTSTPTGQMVGLANKCVDIYDNRVADGTKVQLFRCHGGSNQSWSFPGDGTVRSLGKCLDVSRNTTTGVDTAVINTCSGAASQKWTYQRNGNLTNNSLGKCLDVYKELTANETSIDVYTCGPRVKNQANQLWSLPV